MTRRAWLTIGIIALVIVVAAVLFLTWNDPTNVNGVREGAAALLR